MNFQRDTLYGSERLVEKFKKLTYLGKGAFGLVFAVTVKGEEKALKVIEAPDEETLNEAIEESKNMKKLRGVDNILEFCEVNICEFFVGKKKLFHLEILMDLADETLKDQIEKSKEKRIRESRLIRYMKQIANGLLGAFKKNAAHLDLKPANVLIFGKTAKIADWGGSVFMKPSGHSLLNSQSLNKMQHTPTWASPEFLNFNNIEYSASNKKPNFYLCDIYSFGMVLMNCSGISIDSIREIPKLYSTAKEHDNKIGELVDQIKENGYSKYIYRPLRKMCKFDPNERYSIEDLVEKINSE